MSKSKKYHSYEPWVKAAISLTGKIDLFPHLQIPRMTALYWTTKHYKVEDHAAETLIEALADLQKENHFLKEKAAEQKALQVLLKDVFETLGFKLRWKSIDSKETREKILDAITKALKNVSRDSCLEVLDLSLSRYKRWRRERLGCGLPETLTCPRGSMSQLTFREIQTMRDYVTAKEFSHFPIRSLHYFAKRQGTLLCSYSTWRKYIDLYGWKRCRKQTRKKGKRIGIRGKHPNEIWHLDVSYFILPNGTKCFIQAVIDNFSRYVLAWQVMASFDGARTASLIEEALRKAVTLKAKSGSLRLLVDGGGENKSNKVTELERRGHFEKQVARFEISFSNSMVEALFRSLKNNYLYHEEIRSLDSLRKKVTFWFNEHNERIPHTSFKGETPLERIQKSWTRKDVIRIVVSHENAVKLRLKHNQEIFCDKCKVG